MINSPLIKLAFSGFIFSASLLHADLLFYEPFDYAAGTTIEGQAPALGAGSAWTDTSSGNGTGTPTAPAQPLTVRANGTNGGAASAQTWSGIPSASSFPNSGGYLEGMRRDDNEGHISLDPSITNQFIDGSIIWLSFVSAAATNSANDNNMEVQFALGASSFLDDESGTLNRGRFALGEAVGIGSIFSDSDSGIQAAYWDEAATGSGTFAQNLSPNDSATGEVARITPEQLHIIRIDFSAAGETITTNVFDLAPYSVPTLADFSSGAASITTTSDLDQTAFDTIAFDAVRTNLDEIRIGTTFDDVIGNSQPSEPVDRELLEIVYDEDNDSFDLTWTSNPGDFAGIYWSLDLTNFFPDVNQSIPSHPSAGQTTFGSLANPVPGTRRLFFRIGDPDTQAPTILVAFADSREITVTYSEALLDGSPSDLANYSLTGPGGAAVSVVDARLGDNPNTVILTVGEDLAFLQEYNLVVNQVADPVGNVIAANSSVAIIPFDPALGIPLVINEVMASNSVSPYNPVEFLDEDGVSSDWIEIYNPLGVAINLDGWFLSDDADNLTKWRFPAVIIPAGGYQLVFASNKDRTNSAGELHTNFQLSGGGEYLGLSMPDQTVVSEFAPEFPEQVAGVSYGLLAGSANYRYFDNPTPAAPNGTSGFLGLVGDTGFDMDRGIYDAPFDVALSSVTAGATIRYTLDMSEPTETNGLTYTDGVPIQVTGTTCLRARAFVNGWLPSNIDTQTYIFLDDHINQPASLPGFPSTWGSETAIYAMDPAVTGLYTDQELKDALLSLPTISLVTDMDNLFDPTTGIYANPRSEGLAWERPASVEWIDHTGGPEFQIDAGVRVQGNAARDLPKKPFRLLFKSVYGNSKLDFPMFAESGNAAESFDTIILRANAQGFNYGARTQIADENGRRTALDMGTPQAHGTYAHLYVNGAYWGIYNPTERPQASFCTNYFGGEKEEWDVNNGNTAIDGTYDPFDEMLAQVRGGVADDAAYQRIQGNNPDGSSNAAIPAYLHMPNYIDYMLANFYLGTGDWAGNASQGTRNYYTGRWRKPDSPGYEWFIWDAERSLQYLVPTDASFGPAEPFQWLRNNDEFRLLFADHAQRHLLNGGALEAEQRIARYTELAEKVRLSMKLAEARWDRTTVAKFEGDVADRTSNWFPNRVAIVLNDFRNENLFPSIEAPSFSQHGGSVSPATPVSMATNADTIHYTLDGSDPRLPGGAVSPTAQAATFNGQGPQATTYIATGSDWKYLDDGSDQGTQWRATAFDDSAWASGPSQLGYGDDNGDGTDVGFGASLTNKFATTYFRATVEIANPSEWSHFLMRLKYDDGIAVYLNGVEIERANLAADAAFDDFTGNPVSNENDWKDFIVGTDSFVAGTNTFAVEVHQTSRTSSDMRFDMTLIGEIAGGSNIADPLFFSQPTTLNARAFNSATGEWSALNSAFFSIDTVPADGSNLVISELHYRPAGAATPGELAVSTDRDDYEFIELLNIGTSSVDLSGVHFSDGIDYTFADQTSLDAGARVVIVRDLVAFTERYGQLGPGFVAGEYSGRLSNDGERIALAGPDGTDFRELTYNDQLPWPVEADGDGPSLLLVAPATNPDHTDPTSWTAHPVSGGTPGASD